MICALALAITGCWVSRFDRDEESLYFLLLGLPALILAAEGGALLTGRMRPLIRRAAKLLVLPFLWIVLVMPMAWRSPRAANMVDLWIMVDRLEAVVSGQQHALSDSASPGHSNAYMMFEGLPLLGANRLPITFVQLQLSHMAWAVICAWMLGAAVWQLVSWPAAIVVQSAYLFSPFVMGVVFQPGLFVISQVFTLPLLLLILLARRERLPAVLPAFAVIAGVSSSEPTIGGMVLALTLWMTACVGLDHWKPRPWPAIAAAIAAGFAAIIPHLPTPSTLAAMAREYTFGRIQLIGMEMTLYGQRSLAQAQELMDAAKPGPLDIPLGALLTPAAISRTPMRLFGDVLFEPVSIALFAIGLAISARHASRNRLAGGILLFLLLGLAHGFTSRGDSVSHIRIGPAVPALFVLAAIGFESIRAAVETERSRSLLAPITAGMIALSGWLLFHRVNPTILPSSWLETGLEAVDDRRWPERPILVHPAIPWLYVDWIAALVPLPPLSTRAFSDLIQESVPADQIEIWSPALEQDSGVSCFVCESRPGSRLFTMYDRSGLSRAYAAAPADSDWQPALPRKRWTESSCLPQCREYGTPWLKAPQSELLHCGDGSISQGES